MFPRTLQPYFTFFHWVSLDSKQNLTFPKPIGTTHSNIFILDNARITVFRLTTMDKITLGCWHLCNQRSAGEATDSSLQTHSTPVHGRMQQDIVRQLVKDAKIVFVYFHGVAGNRSTSSRVSLYKWLLSLDDKHQLVTLDYRGFGDSGLGFAVNF